MIFNRKLPVLLFFSMAIIILVVRESHSQNSDYHPAGFFQSLYRKWQQFFDGTRRITNSDVQNKVDGGDSSAGVIKEQARTGILLSSEETILSSSMFSDDEKLAVPQFLGVGRQQISECSCIAELDAFGAGSCTTTCFATFTPCGGRICTRTTSLTAFSSPVDPMFPKQIKNIDEKACESLEVSCILSSALATSSSSSAVAAITTAVANAALSAGIAVGAVALGLAAAKNKKNKNNYDDQYYETEDHSYETEEYYPPKYYAKRQGRNDEKDPKVSRDSDDEINSLPTEIPDGSDNSLAPEIASSMTDEVSTFGRQTGCNCAIPPVYGFNGQCSTTCYSFQQLCGGQICTLTTFFTAFFFNDILCQHTTTNYKDCETLDGVCSLSTALYTVAQPRNALATYAIIAGGLSSGFAAGNIAVTGDQPPVQCQQPQQPPPQQQQQQPQQPEQQLRENQTPNIVLPIPVEGTDCPDDGCGDNSIRFRDGNCYPIFSSCNGTNFWVTFDNAFVQNGCGSLGKCTPRLCDDQRVFVGRTGVCNDINDPFECSGGRRLYYTAFGDSVCDCPIGEFPFPNPQDNCVALFSQGPCPGGQVVTLSQGGRLFCTPNECEGSTISNSESLVSFVPSDKGPCQAIGSRGTCSSVQFLGYDVFKRQLQCTNVTDPTSPYFSFLRERRFDKKIFSQMPQIERKQKKIDVPIKTVHQNFLIKTNDTDNRRQSTFGLFQFPTSVSNSLLQPCRPGVRNGFNQKCTNPLVSNSNRRPESPPVRPNFSCPANSFLQSGGQCTNDRRTTSCGPSFQFNSLTGQCRPRF